MSKVSHRIPGGGHIVNLRPSSTPSFVDNLVLPSLPANLGAIMGEVPDVIHSDFRSLPIPDGAGLLPLTTSTGSPLLGQASDRLWDGTDHTSRIVAKLVGAADGFRMASGLSFVPGADSFGAIAVFRMPVASTSNCIIIGKRSGLDLNGWNISVLPDGRVFMQVDHGPAHRSVIIPGSVIGNDWHVAKIVCNRSNDVLYGYTESAFATGTITGYGDIDSTDEPFGLGLSSAFPAPSNGIELAYDALWLGPKSENLGAAPLATFWQPQLDNPPA